MLGSLIRLLAFLALVVGGTWGVTELLAVEPVTIRFQGVETEITAIAAVAIVLGGFIALYLAFRLLGLLLAVLRFLTGDKPTRKIAEEYPAKSARGRKTLNCQLDKI